MKKALCSTFIAATFADQCCYHDCGSSGCNPAGSYCSQSQSNCEGNCHGTFCPSGPSPSPPGPSPPPAPAPPGTLYCPSKDDLTVAYGDGVTLMDGGWKIHGGSGAATKAAYDLRGGYVEFTYDVSKVGQGVNTNIYTISPTIQASGFNKPTDYCDGADNDSPWCMEDDWVESNGNCGGATTLHTVPGPGMFCGSWGCRAEYHYNGATSDKWRIEYDVSGHMTVKRGGQTISPGSLSPGAKDSDWEVVKNTMASKGVVLYSSLWGNWVPVDSCGAATKEPSPVVDNSEFVISNLKISGRVAQGPEPTKCGGEPDRQSKEANPITDKIKALVCEEIEKGGVEDEVVNAVCSKIASKIPESVCVPIAKHLYQYAEKECSPSEVVV